MDTNKILLATIAGLGVFFLYKYSKANATTTPTTYYPGTALTNQAPPKTIQPGITYKSNNVDINLPASTISKVTDWGMQLFGTKTKQGNVSTPSK